MIKKLQYILLVFIVLCWGCADNSQKEKHQNNRDNITNVRQQIKEIDIQEVIIGQVARLYIVNNYLFIADHKSTNKLIHIFDKSTFSYITSIADIGQGPGEIINMGHIEENKANHIFYVSDHGKQRIFAYDLDSILINPLYIPKVKVEMDKGQFPDIYKYINDTLSIGLIIEPIGTSDFKQSVARWNMNTGDLKSISYTHPEIKKKRVNYDVSIQNGIFVECYSNYDLMTICDLKGDLKFNIYGPNWSNNTSKKASFYKKVLICKNRIIATYLGEDKSDTKRFPTKILIFNLNGEYIKTLETSYSICDFCYDEDNNRIILNFDDDIQFGYLSLDGILESN